MRIGVVQHRLRPTAAENVRALADAVRRAAADGAEMISIPCVHGIAGDAVREGVVAELRELDLPCGLFAPASYSAGQWGVVDSLCCAEVMGPVVAMCGDPSLDERVWREAVNRGVSAAVMSPSSESDLQAEAALEVALGLSDSLCGLVIVSECVGADAGAPGHGGSAIIRLGEVVAEAVADVEDLLMAEIDVPVPAPEPRAPFPALPTILAQRLAVHSGRTYGVGYPADLSGSRSQPGTRPSA